MKFETRIGIIRLLAVATVALVFVTTAGWEFFVADHLNAGSSPVQHWHSIITATLASAVAVAILYLACRRYITRQERAESQLEEENLLRQQAEIALKSSERALNQSQRVARLAHWRWSFADRRLTSWSGEFSQIFGITNEEVDPDDEGQFRWVHPDDRERLAAGYDAATSDDPGFDICYRIIRGDGEIRHVREVAEPEFDAAGNVVAHFGILQDITELRHAEEALRESEARYRSLYNNTPVMMHSLDADGRLLSVSEHWLKGLGYDREEVIGRQVVEFMTETSRDYARRISLPAFYQTGVAKNVEYQFVTKHGEVIDVLVSAISETDLSGRFVRSLAVLNDVTERKKTLTALRQSEERFRAIIENSPNAISLKDANGHYMLVNSDFEALAGSESEDIIGKTSFQFFDRAFAESGARHDRDVIDSKSAIARDERFVRGDTVKDFLTIKFPIVGDDENVTAVGAIHVDLTERNRTEAQLRRSQRMEAVGQLTGGVAHDFNNLLASVMLDAGLLGGRVGKDEKGRLLVEHIRKAVERGKSLTDRLLAFSRQQSLSPRPSDVSGLIAGLEEMLRRTLGATVDLRVENASRLWPALIDPHQFENALVNLAINARDSMPDGGTLNIATGNISLSRAYALRHQDVTPGDYVAVVVSDSGSGMSPEVLEKVFEPFFTTKQAGGGSGLGLSMVYGFAKQSNGHVTIESRQGQGTIVSLYLTRSAEPAAIQDHDDRDTGIVKGAECILVVEDDRALRRASVSVLCDNGYEVAEAWDGSEAMDHLRSGRTFDLLFTDLVLPGGMTGVDVAEQAVRLQPGIKVLYTTGYADTTLTPAQKLKPDASLIEKPCEKEALLETIRGVLDREVA